MTKKVRLWDYEASFSLIKGVWYDVESEDADYYHISVAGITKNFHKNRFEVVEEMTFEVGKQYQYNNQIVTCTAVSTTGKPVMLTKEGKEFVAKNPEVYTLFEEPKKYWMAVHGLSSWKNKKWGGMLYNSYEECDRHTSMISGRTKIVEVVL